MLVEGEALKVRFNPFISRSPQKLLTFPQIGQSEMLEKVLNIPDSII